jgi:hypothetical protein
MVVVGEGRGRSRGAELVVVWEGWGAMLGRRFGERDEQKDRRGVVGVS